jgi:hypothetical protein
MTITVNPLPKFWSGDKVRKVGGDYRFEGIIVAAFTKLSGARRCVVEDDRGILHIFSEAQIEAIR